MALLKEEVTHLETKLTHADDRIRLSDWLPPQWGGIPHIRLGKRWVNLCWLLPLGFLFLIVAVAVAQELRQHRRRRLRTPTPQPRVAVRGVPDQREIVGD